MTTAFVLRSREQIVYDVFASDQWGKVVVLVRTSKLYAWHNDRLVIWKKIIRSLIRVNYKILLKEQKEKKKQSHILHTYYTGLTFDEEYDFVLQWNSNLADYSKNSG